MFRSTAKVILLIVCSISQGDSISLCSARNDAPCVLACQSVDPMNIVFKKDNTDYASCKWDFHTGNWNCTYHYPGRFLITHLPSSTAVLFLNITKVSRARDEGIWTCKFEHWESDDAQYLAVLDPNEKVALRLCNAPIKEKPCVVRCIIPYPEENQSVIFNKDDTEYASCRYEERTKPWNCTYRYPGSTFIPEQSEQPNVMNLHIRQLSRERDQGLWTCQFDGIETETQDLKVLNPNEKVALRLCNAPIKEKPCVVRCIIPYPEENQSVIFNKDDTEYASCRYEERTESWNCTYRYPGSTFIPEHSQQPNVMNLHIRQLSRERDQGLWTCQFDGMETETQDLKVLTEPTHICMSGDTNINYCLSDFSATYDVTVTVACSSAVNISAALSAPITGSSYTERLEVTKGSMCSDQDEHVYTAVYTITGTTALTGGGNTLMFETQLSGGVGMVYRDVFASNITFSCL